MCSPSISIILFTLLLRTAPVASWHVTKYIQESTSTSLDDFTYATYSYLDATTWVVSPTTAVTGSPVSTSTYTYGNEVVTEVEVLLPSDAPVTRAPRTCNWQVYDLDCVSGPINSGTSTRVLAPIVYSAPSSCDIEFNYTTAVEMTDFPDFLIPEVTPVMETTYETTSSLFGYSTVMTTFTQVDIYLSWGAATPTPDLMDGYMLSQCEDPRAASMTGCYQGMMGPNGDPDCVIKTTFTYPDPNGPTGVQAAGSPTNILQLSAGAKVRGKAMAWIALPMVLLYGEF